MHRKDHPEAIKVGRVLTALDKVEILLVGREGLAVVLQQEVQVPQPDQALGVLPTLQLQDRFRSLSFNLIRKHIP